MRHGLFSVKQSSFVEVFHLKFAEFPNQLVYELRTNL